MEERIMGLSRRQFSKEFKLAALQRLERGASVGEVARAFEISANLLHRWRQEFGKGRATRFQAQVSGGGKKAEWLNWSARLDSRPWRLIF
jgi:transposase